MQKYNVSKHKNFYVIGISYQKADAKTRGKFNLNIDQRKALLDKAKSIGLISVVTSSTCNRTEIYAFADEQDVLIDLLCEFSIGDQETFSENGYVLKNLKSQGIHLQNFSPLNPYQKRFRLFLRDLYSQEVPEI